MESEKLKLLTFLPFVSKVDWSDDPIEFGNFNQQFYYAHNCTYFWCFNVKRKRVIEEERVESGMVGALRREGVDVDDDEEEEGLMGQVVIEEERVESGVAGALRREGVNVDDDKEEEELFDDDEVEEGLMGRVVIEEDTVDGPIKFGNFDYVRALFGSFYVRKRVIEEETTESGVVGALRREGVHVDDDEEDKELIGEVLECCCSSNSASNKLTRAVPNNITRWSLLTMLRLKSDMMIGDGGGSIPQVSVLKSVAHSNLQTLAHVKLSLDHGPSNCHDRRFHIWYGDQEEGDEYVDLFCLSLYFHPDRSASLYLY